MITLFKEQTINASSVIVRLNSDKGTRNNNTNERIIVPSGVFDGASITIQISADGINFVDMASNVATSANAEIVYLPNELYVQATVMNAGTSTNINYHVV